MNMLKFMISDTEYIKVIPEYIDKDDCEICSQIDIEYVDEEKNVTIRFGYEHLSSFCYFMAEYGYVEKLLNNEMILDKAAIGDPGIEWNKYTNGYIGKKETNKFHFFGNSHKQIYPSFDGWLYNNKDGNVILEITPFYPWHHTRKKLNPNFISYKQFMKDYKPVVQTMIPKENLKKWIPQALELKRSLGIHND